MYEASSIEKLSLGFKTLQDPHPNYLDECGVWIIVLLACFFSDGAWFALVLFQVGIETKTLFLLPRKCENIYGCVKAIWFVRV